MRGHEPIIAMRQRGQKPALVYLDTMRDHSPMQAWRDWPGTSPAIPTVWVQDADAPARLDLRFLVDLTVVVTSADPERVRQLERAAIDAGAFRVIAAVVEPVNARGGMHFRAARVTDSLLPTNDTEPQEAAQHG